MTDFRNLTAYKKAYALAMEIFELSKTFPKEEIYVLTDQIRRSSRSVAANLSEAYRKRTYPKHFLSKLSDADMENSETTVWLDFSLDCGYISVQQHNVLLLKNQEIGKLIGHMLYYPEKYGAGKTLNSR